MAKESGLGWTLFSIDDSGGTQRALVNDALNIDWDMPRETLDVTGLDLSAHERLIGLADFTLNVTLAFNDHATVSSFNVLKTIASTDVARELAATISGQKLYDGAANFIPVWLTSAALARVADGSFQFTATAILSNGLLPQWTT